MIPHTETRVSAHLSEPAGEDASPAPRPRLLLVGALSELRRRARLDEAFELSSLAGAPIPTPADHLDVVVLDGALPPEELSRCLASLEPPGSPGRPAVLVAVPRGRRVPRDLLDGRVDDFVSAALGEWGLYARIGAALRTRGFLLDLSRKNAELEQLYARLECLARRMAEELRLASNVQRSLLPPPFSHERLDVAREFMPFREIGGDYYDIVPLGPQRVAVAIGDVMGKGVPAALLAANLKVCLRAQVQSCDLSAEELVGRVNRLFWEVTPKGRFASLFFGVFDFERGHLQYVNAGQDYPFHVRSDGVLDDLSTGGTVLGLADDSRYERGEVGFCRDDVFVFYTDGVTDRGNANGDLYGIDRLKEAAARNRSDGARLTLYTLLGDVQDWSSGSAPEDDMTLVVAKVR